MPDMLLYIFAAAAVTYAVRVLPITLLRRPIESPFLQSFLYYVPYVTLSVMTFPAMIDATQSLAAGIAALAMGIFFAYRGASLPKVAALCCGTVLLLELLL
jgi:branched-subunit amino acid transport protein